MQANIYTDGLQTERLTTRWLTQDDTEAWVAFYQDEDAGKFVQFSNATTPAENAKAFIEFQLNRYKNNELGLQALMEKQTGNFIGVCGLLTQTVEGKAEIEVGYHLFKKYWGQGFAPEAAKMFVNYAFENNISDSVISLIDMHNKNSQLSRKKWVNN
jgi:[ribosomal protein S5]-alanine N-acetyltransferase